jgi:hypothetical protein
MDLGVLGGMNRDCIFSGGAYGGITIDPSLRHTWWFCPNVWTSVARFNTGNIPLSIAFSSWTLEKHKLG